MHMEQSLTAAELLSSSYGDLNRSIEGPCLLALNTLTPAQIAFLHVLPKAELHAHLNGSIPLAVLQELAAERERESAESNVGAPLTADVRSGLEHLQRGVQLKEIGEFFGLFPAIYELTSTPDALRRVTRAVLHSFIGPPPDESASVHDALDHPPPLPQCSYLELRTGPRTSPHMSRRDYLVAVLDELERYTAAQAALIVALDRRMDRATAEECVNLAVELKREGRRVVGLDLCGDPRAGDVDMLCEVINAGRQAGLKVTLHIAETAQNPAEETLKLLSCKPSRLGHATFLNDEAKQIVMREKMAIEICLSSNILCKTVQSIDAHHIRYYLANNHPVAICTDDILPFRNSMLGEYALLLARPPFGLGLTEQEVEKIAAMSMACRFTA